MAGVENAYTVSLTAKKGNSVLFSRVAGIDLSTKFSTVFRKYNGDSAETAGQLENVLISKSENGPWQDVSPEESMCVLRDLGLRHVLFKVSEDDVEQAPAPTSTFRLMNAFEILMGTSQLKTLPVPRYEKTKKDKLYNDLISHLGEDNNALGFPASVAETEGAYVIQTLANALWYVTTHHDTINSRAYHRATVQRVPDVWSRYAGYDDFNKKRKAAPKCSSSTLKLHAEALMTLVQKPSISVKAWSSVNTNIQLLAKCLSSYAAFLDEEKNNQAKRQSMTHPVREISDLATIQLIEKTEGEVAPEYRRLDEAVRALPIGGHLFFDESIHAAEPIQPSHRYWFIHQLRLSEDVDVLKYSPGGSHGQVVVLSRQKPNRTKNEIATDSARLLAECQPKLPSFHTYQMKRQFKQKYSNIVKISPHILRSIYSTLAMDFSADQNPLMDERMRMALLGEPGIIVDMRHLNKGRPGEAFDVFFPHFEAEVERVLAADDRRHNIAHLSEWISLPDMIQKVAAQCPEGTPIPSKSLVRLQFMPRNPNSNTALTFTKRFPVQYKIQRRQLRNSHPDAHYCAAQFKYMREMAIQCKDHTNFFCLDDKSKIPFGEPGTVMATGVRGRQTLLPSTSTLSAADHDQHSKGSFTPSVALHVDIPNHIDSSFYQGQVTVVLNDAVFQPSSPFRHAAALRPLLIRDQKPILMMYTDGGPDHRLTFESVKVSLIALFKACNLDMLIAGRCAPGHSWGNPVERVMSLLNLALQNVALERPLASPEVEEKLKKCNSMQAIREAAEKEKNLVTLRAEGTESNNASIEESWLRCIEPNVSLIRGRFERLKLKDKQVETQNPVSDDQIKSLEGFALQIDNSIDLTKLQKRFMKNKRQYQEWMKVHTRSRHYTFQIRKCNDTTCCPERRLHNIHWLPDPVVDETGTCYKPFNKVYGAEDTTDENRPGNMPFDGKITEEEQGCNTSLLTAQRARLVTKCGECQKPRVVYCESKKSITAVQLMDLERCVEEFDYTCGSPFLPRSHPLFKKVFVRLGLTCANPVEFPFYSSPIGIPDVCAHCGCSGASRPQRLVMDYKVVLPACSACITSGKQYITARPRPGVGNTPT